MLDNIIMGIGAIALHKGRAFLTMLGIIIGVSSVILIFGIAQGVKQDVTESIQGLGSNMIIVVPGKLSPGRFYNPGQVSTVLTFEDVRTIEDVPGVKGVSPLTVISNVAKGDNTVDQTAVNVGASEMLVDILNLKVKKGRFLTKGEIDKNATVAVLGSGPAEALFPRKDPVGKTITVKNQELTVVGTLERAPASSSLGGANLDAMVVVPYTTSSSLLGSGIIARIVATADDADNVESVKKDIAAKIEKNHGGVEDFTVLTQQDILDTASRILDTFASMIVSIAAISLLVGGIGIMNMMLVSVTERTREIGIRKAMGATKGDILTQFLFEAVSLSFIGAIVGLALAYIASAFLNRYSEFLHPYISSTALALALLMAFLVGIVFGIVPAVRAARKDPIEALRYE
ncbi:MAG: ABC transporter permease [Candidatus Aquicultorales bacterium]